MSFGVTGTAGGTLARRALRSVGGAAAGPVLNSGLSVAGAPFWENWVLDLTFTGGTLQQYEWATEALNECTFPMEALGVKIDVVWGPLPSGSDTRHPYMITQFTAGDHATIYIPPWADDPTAPLLQGLPNAQADIKEFYKESFVHELGHVTVGATIDSPNRSNRAALIAQAVVLFTRIADGRRGTSSDWDDPSLSWADEIREAIAEAFKCSFYSERQKLIYKNRSNWTISRRDWASLLKLWEPGSFDFVNIEDVDGEGDVHTSWFFGGSTFESFDGSIAPVDWSWMPGGTAKSHFGSFDPGIPTPPSKPPFASNHGWGSDDETQTWAFGNINRFNTTPPLPHTQSRKGQATLLVQHMARQNCSAGMTLYNDIGRSIAEIGYVYDTSLGLGLPTSYGISTLATSRNSPAPLLPPVLFVIEVDADADTLTVGLTDGSTDSHHNYVYIDSISGPIGDGRAQALYYPQARFGWGIVGDDPQWPNNSTYSELSVGPATWTTEPTPVKGPYPYPTPLLIGPHRSGLLRVD